MAKPSDGFTLLELLLVMALAALVMAVTLPSLTISPVSKLEQATGLVAAELRQTRLTAMESGQPTALLIHLQDHWLAREHREAQTALPDDLTLELTTARREMLNAHLGGIRFFPDGSSTGGRVALELAGWRGRVDVEWLTGRVRVTRPSS